MSIDIDLQQRVDAILNQTLETYAGTAGREKFNKLSVILMNPMTGEIYATVSYTHLDVYKRQVYNKNTHCLFLIGNNGLRK